MPKENLSPKFILECEVALTLYDYLTNTDQPNATDFVTLLLNKLKISPIQKSYKLLKDALNDYLKSLEDRRENSSADYNEFY